MADNKLFAIDTEATVLSCILKNPVLINSIDGLKFYMFSSSPNQVIFGEMEELKEKQFLPDLSLVLGSLDAKNRLNDAGGKSYLNTLASKEVNADAFTEFVKLVIASYKARTFISFTSGVKKDNLNADNIDDIISSTRKNLDSLMELRENSMVFSIDDIADEAYEEIMARLNKPGIKGVTWGLESLDSVTGGKSPGDLMIIAARPGMGKTALVCNSVLADANAGVPCLLLEREMRKQELFERLISIDTGIPNNFIQQGLLTKDKADIVRDSIEKLRKLPIYIDVNHMANDPVYFETTISKYHNKHGVQNVYLDYLQLATDRDDHQTQAIGQLTRMSKLMANNLNICMILLSQLNRNLEQREDKRPLLSDMKQAGAIEEDADFVVGLYRDDVYHPETKAKNLMEFIILKHRNGPPGTIPVKFDGPTFRLSEA